MDRGIARSKLSEPMIVHRGSGPELLGGLTDPQEIMKQFGGKTVRDKGFTSTSTVIGSDFKGAIHYKITVPAGKGRGGFLEPMSHFPRENEFLIKRNAGFVVRKAYRGVDGRTVVEMGMKG